MARYEPRPRGSDLLYDVLRSELATLLDTAERAGRPLPRHVRRELTDYLACGIGAHGFALLRCTRCDAARVVAFSCKGRTFCPSCGGRRMAQTAAHLVDRVLPAVGLRQWVLTLPFPLRYRLAWDTALCAAVLRTFLRVVFGFYEQQATALGLPGGRTGSVTFIQSFGSTLNLNVHFHALVLDGVYIWDDDGDAPVFHPIPPPRTSEVQQLVDTIRDRVQRLLVRRGLLQDSDATDDLEEQEGLRLMQQASVAGRVALGPRAGRKARCLRGPPRPGAGLPNRCARSGWFNLHAGVRIAPCDAEGRERLCRYVARPPLSHDRLTRREDGTLVLRLKRPFLDGTSAVLLSPLELVQRLAALVLPPRFHRVRYHGVLGPAARWRSHVVPHPAPVERHPLRPHCSTPAARSPWIPWADLLWRVFGVDAWTCPRPGCGAPMRIHAVVQGVWATHRVLSRLGLPSRAPRLLPARGPPDVL